MLAEIEIQILHRGVRYGLKVDITFSGTKIIVSWLQRANWNKRYRVRIKSMALLQNCKFKFLKKYVVLKCKKMFLVEKIDGNVLIFFFSEIPKIFICVRVRDGAFLSED